MSETQAVTDETDAAPQAQTEANGEQVDDLDSILSEFEPEPNPEPKPDPSTMVEGVKEAVGWIREQKEAEAAKQTQEDIDKAVEFITGEMVISQKLANGYLHQIAANDQRFMKAFTERHQNPGGWQKVLDGVKAEFAKEVNEQPDAQLTADRDAARAAVQGTSTTSPDPQPTSNADLNNMSDAEFKAYKAGLG